MEIADELRGKPALAVEPSDLRTAFQNKVEERNADVKTNLRLAGQHS